MSVPKPSFTYSKELEKKHFSYLCGVAKLTD